MLLKDMKPNTEYATCDGRLVVTDKADKVTRGWYQFTEYSTDPNTQQRVQISKIERGNPLAAGKSPDPWADCNAVSPRNGVIRVHVKNGVRVTEYAYDRNGKRTGKGVERVMLPQEIPGTWADYVLLHADKIEARFRRAELDVEAKAETKRLRDALKKAGYKIRESYYTSEARRNPDSIYVSVGNDGARLVYDLRVDGSAVEALLVQAGILPKSAAAPKKRAPRKTTRKAVQR